MKGIIIGAGIAGLTAAIALRKAGLEIEVFEAAKELKPVGAGIWMASNAMQVFDRLGFAQSVVNEGIELQGVATTDRHLKLIQELKMKNIKNKFGFSFTAIHRARLQQVLIEQLETAVPVHLGKHLQRIESSQNSVTAYFEDGSTAVGDFLIGADGVHSVVREQLFPKQSIYRYSGQTCWRGVVNFELKDRLANSTVEAWGGKVRLGVSSIGHGETYWFAVKVAEEQGSDDPKTLKAQLLKDFSCFASPFPDIIDATEPEHIVRNDIGEMSELPQWYKGPLCLIGDAVHSMTPNMGQGGGQSVEDAYFLAKCFEENSNKDLQQIFNNFQLIRKKKVRYITKTAWRLGKISHWTWGQGLRNTFFRIMPAYQMEKIMIKILDLEVKWR